MPRAGRPLGAPSLRRQQARLPRSASNFLPTAICLGGGAPRRDKEALRQAGVVGWLCHAEAARPRSRESWHSLLHYLSRGIRGLPRLPHSLKDGFGPRGSAACGPGPESASHPWLQLAGEAGRAVRARPLLAVPLTSGPRRGATPACGPAGTPARAHSCKLPSPVGPTPRNTHWATRRSCCQATLGLSSCSQWQAEQKHPKELNTPTPLQGQLP